MRTISVAALIVLGLTFSSCYKTRKCQCYDASGTPDTSEGTTTNDASKIKKIEDDCNTENSKRTLNNTGHCTLS